MIQSTMHEIMTLLSALSLPTLMLRFEALWTISTPQYPQTGPTQNHRIPSQEHFSAASLASSLSPGLALTR